jgi:hypothetical protein
MGLSAERVGSGVTVFLCDTFSGVVKAGDNDSHYKGGEHSDASIEIVLELISEIGVSNIKTLSGIFPDETGGSIADRKFSCVISMLMSIFRQKRCLSGSGPGCR